MLASYQKYLHLYVNKWFCIVHNDYPKMRSYHLTVTTLNMNITDYWLMAREYSIGMPP